MAKLLQCSYSHEAHDKVFLLASFHFKDKDEVWLGGGKAHVKPVFLVFATVGVLQGRDTWAQVEGVTEEERAEIGNTVYSDKPSQRLVDDALETFRARMSPSMVIFINWEGGTYRQPEWIKDMIRVQSLLKTSGPFLIQPYDQGLLVTAGGVPRKGGIIVGLRAGEVSLPQPGHSAYEEYAAIIWEDIKPEWEVIPSIERVMTIHPGWFG